MTEEKNYVDYPPSIKNRWRLFDLFSTPEKRWIKSRTIGTAIVNVGNVSKIKFVIERFHESITIKEYHYQDGKWNGRSKTFFGHLQENMKNVFSFKERVEKIEGFSNFKWGVGIEKILKNAKLL